MNARVFAAILLDVWRESRARHVTRILWGVVALLLLFFGFVQSLEAETVRIKMYMWYYFLFYAAVFTGILATSPWVSQAFSRGVLDRYLVRPLGRAPFLFARLLGSYLVVLSGYGTLIAGMFVIGGVRTGVWDTTFLWAALVPPMLTFLGVFLYMAVVGLWTTSPPATALAGFGTFALSFVVAIARQRIALGFEPNLIWEWIVRALHWLLPPVQRLMAAGKFTMRGEAVDWPDVLIAAAVPIAAAALAAGHLFNRKDF